MGILMLMIIEMEEEMNLNQYIDEMKDELISALQTCIQYKSVKDLDTSSPGAPFGQGIKDCLDWTLDLGESFGFIVKNVDGYAGHIELGTGELIGILGHLDVVPEGEGWSVHPYEGKILDGKIYGRGAVDDKGPTLAALFAMKAIKDLKIPLQKRVRLILGTDEESGWADMDYYKEKEEIPILGFAPDAEFPLIHAEKGILHLEFSQGFSTPLRHILQIRGGDRANVVPDTCTVVLKDLSLGTIQERLQETAFPEGVSAELGNEDEGIKLTFKGVSAHGSLPQKGKNAVLFALEFLKELDLSPEENELIQWIYEGSKGCYGEGFDIALADEPSGKLSLNLGIMDCSEKHIRFVLDIRYPVTFQKADILDPLTKVTEKQGLNLSILSHQEAHHVPKDSPLVQGLLKAYSEVTGKEGFAFAIGGGTYAKVMTQGVAFGPSFPGEPEVIHSPDEYISIDNLILATKIYAQAILNIAQ